MAPGNVSDAGASAARAGNPRLIDRHPQAHACGLCCCIPCVTEITQRGALRASGQLNEDADPEPEVLAAR